MLQCTPPPSTKKTRHHPRRRFLVVGFLLPKPFSRSRVQRVISNYPRRGTTTHTLIVSLSPQPPRVWEKQPLPNPFSCIGWFRRQGKGSSIGILQTHARRRRASRRTRRTGASCRSRSASRPGAGSRRSRPRSSSMIAVLLVDCFILVIDTGRAPGCSSAGRVACRRSRAWG